MNTPTEKDMIRAREHGFVNATLATSATLDKAAAASGLEEYRKQASARNKNRAELREVINSIN